jgi:glycerophosphoryl diester phosphodiesterase
VAMRRRLPGIAATALPEMEVTSMWVYHAIVTPQLAAVTEAAGAELIAWTVDDLPRMRKLVEAGVTGLCSNDPRLFASLEGGVLD